MSRMDCLPTHSTNPLLVFSRRIDCGNLFMVFYVYWWEKGFPVHDEKIT